MNRKITIILSFVIIAVIAVAVVIGNSRGVQPATKALAATGSVTNNESDGVKSAHVIDAGFRPLTPDLNAAPTARDVLIAADHAAQAPAFAKGTWYNSEPTTLEKLRGQVVLVDFWTYGCYNCINTLPALKSYYSKYRDQGFTIVGVETPEFDSEKIPANLQGSMNKHGIKYPVVTDYNAETWRAYNIDAWPTIIILDKQGRIRYTHIGEGSYEVQENVIKTLLAEK